MAFTHRKRKLKADGLQQEYGFDYRKARPNSFAPRYKVGSRVVVLDPDIARAFKTPESVNAVLRALLNTIPRQASTSAATHSRTRTKHTRVKTGPTGAA
jgi:16S rRNA A1518/A1519 N6-dimethyltransferase RsmA/KsgA/DIM1 with predicted DNA glycosylase/AP lyase activity